MTWTLDGFDLDAFVAATLAEDLGAAGDITSAAVIPAQARFAGVMRSREPIVVAGLPLAHAFFRALDADVAFERAVADGARCEAGDILLEVRGNARALLTAERSALNTLQHLSGIATLTRRYADAIHGTGAILLDTRKTIPGLRVLEKYATRAGGAQNHRMGLYDAAMIKDNHVAVAGSGGEGGGRGAPAGIERVGSRGGRPPRPRRRHRADRRRGRPARPDRPRARRRRDPFAARQYGGRGAQGGGRRGRRPGADRSQRRSHPRPDPPPPRR